MIDIKSASKTPSEITPQYRFQVATYTQLSPQSNGTARVDTLVKNKTPKLVHQEFTVDQADVAQTQIMYPRVQQAIRSGLVLPNRGSMFCSRNHCSYWRHCVKEFGGHVA